MDPGQPSGPLQTHYTGLEDPPAVRSGEPGRSYELVANRIGSLGSGSPIFFRDIPAGEVLNYDLGPHGDHVTIHVFVRAPYDSFVTPDTHFWNTSGIAVDVGAQGIQLRVTSLQAALAGGIAFDISKPGQSEKPSPSGTVFRLYDTQELAQAAGYSERVKLVTYFQGSVRGLAVGAPVELNGIQIGAVTGIHLLFDPYTATSRVAVHMEVQPQRFLSPGKQQPGTPLEVARNLVRHGLRAQLSTANFLTGQLLVAFQFDPNAPAADARMEGDEIVLPGTTGGLDTIATNLAAIARKLGALPLDSVVRNLDDALAGIGAVVNGQPLRQTLTNLDTTTRQLPAVMRQLNATLGQVAKLVSSANQGYGERSEFRSDLRRLMQQLNDTARSVRLLADYLSAHPEALIRGRAR